MFQQLRLQPNVEFNSDFVFGSDARFSGGRDPEVGLLHGGLAGSLAILQRHVDRERLCLPTQRQSAAQRPLALAGSLRTCGLEHDLLIALAVEHFRAQHRLLHFGAIFLGRVLVDHAQRSRIHVYFNRSVRASQPGEYARLADVDR
jgi:hypothetical protein